MHPRPMAIQISSQPISVANNGHPVKRQVSGDSTGTFASPSTNSSDSSPEMVGSTSTASYDQSPATEEASELSKSSFSGTHFLLSASKDFIHVIEK